MLFVIITTDWLNRVNISVTMTWGRGSSSNRKPDLGRQTWNSFIICWLFIEHLLECSPVPIIPHTRNDALNFPVVLPHGCLIGTSNSMHPQLDSLSSSPSVPPTAPHPAMSSDSSCFQLLKLKVLMPLFFFHTLHPIHQEVLWSVSPKYNRVRALSTIPMLSHWCHPPSPRDCSIPTPSTPVPFTPPYHEEGKAFSLCILSAQ